MLGNHLITKSTISKRMIIQISEYSLQNTLGYATSALYSHFVIEEEMNKITASY